MSDWRISAETTAAGKSRVPIPSREAALVQALHLERRQHCRIQIIEGPNGEVIDRETFEREHLKKPRP
jgi:hypothetical protein